MAEPSVPDPLGDPLGPTPGPDRTDMPRRPSEIRVFGSGNFFRLWLAQVVSSLGDWIGLVAIVALAGRLGGAASQGAAIGLVMSARFIPGFFLGPVGGVLVDRWDRKRVMVVCDIGRGLVLASIPFIDTIAGLFFASLVLEVLSLLWTPAKEASVPNLVAPERLSTANSLSLVAAYGTFPVAAAVSAILFKVAERLGRFDALDALRVNQESVAIYFDVVTFFLSAVIISTLSLPRTERKRGGRIDLSATFVELKEGWNYIGVNPVVRAVMIGLGTGLFGGGMVVPLGLPFAEQVLGGGPTSFSLLLTALGMGAAAGVLFISALQRHLPKERIFMLAVFGGGAFLFVGASSTILVSAFAAVAGLGLCAGTVYVVGFTILHENVTDELRGRIFATLYTLVRLCLLLALGLAPFLAELLGQVSRQVFGADRSVQIAGLDLFLPGVRLALWFGALVILAAAVLAARALRHRPAASALST